VRAFDPAMFDVCYDSFRHLTGSPPPGAHTSICCRVTAPGGMLHPTRVWSFHGDSDPSEHNQQRRPILSFNATSGTHCRQYATQRATYGSKRSGSQPPERVSPSGISSRGGGELTSEHPHRTDNPNSGLCGNRRPSPVTRESVSLPELNQGNRSRGKAGSPNPTALAGLYEKVRIQAHERRCREDEKPPDWAEMEQAPQEEETATAPTRFAG